MLKSLNFMRAGLIAATALSVAATAHAAPPADKAKSLHSCFFITDWQNWKSPSPNVLYLGVNGRDVYEVDLSAGSNQLQSPGMHLVSRVWGGSSICDALDLNLEVSDGMGFREPLIAQSIRKLTPDEIAAIPKQYRP